MALCFLLINLLLAELVIDELDLLATDAPEDVFLYELKRRFGDYLGDLNRNSLIKKSLKKGGRFIQYQYWMVNKKDVKKHFRMERIHLEPRNFSPAFIYITDKE